MSNFSLNPTNLRIHFAFLLMFLFGCSDATGPSTVTGDYYLVFMNQNFNDEIGKLSLDGKQYETIFRPNNPGPHESIDFAQLSPDHSTIVTCGGPNPEYGYFPIWLMSKDGDFLYQVTTNGYRPRWSLDGKWLYYSKLIAPKANELDLYRYNFETQNEELLLLAHFVEIREETHYVDYLLSDVNSTNINEVIVREKDVLLDDNFYVVAETIKLMLYNVVTGQKEYLNIPLDSLIIGVGSINPNDGKLYFMSSPDSLSYDHGYFHSYDLSNSELTTIFSPDGRERLGTFVLSPVENKVTYLVVTFITLPDYKPDRLYNIIVRDLFTGDEEIILSPERGAQLMQWVISEK